jgi:hypothetical protein
MAVRVVRDPILHGPVLNSTRFHAQFRFGNLIDPIEANKLLHLIPIGESAHAFCSLEKSHSARNPVSKYEFNSSVNAWRRTKAA